MVTRLCIVLRGGFEFHRHPASTEQEEGYEPVEYPNTISIEGSGKPVEIKEGAPGYEALSALMESHIKLYEFAENIDERRSDAARDIMTAHDEGPDSEG